MIGAIEALSAKLQTRIFRKGQMNLAVKVAVEVIPHRSLNIGGLRAISEGQRGRSLKCRRIEPLLDRSL